MASGTYTVSPKSFKRVHGNVAQKIRAMIDKTTTAETLGYTGKTPVITKSLTNKFAARMMGKTAPIYGPVGGEAVSKRILKKAVESSKYSRAAANIPGNKELRRTLGKITPSAAGAAGAKQKGILGALGGPAAKGLGMGLIAYLVASELLGHREKMQQMEIQEQALTNTSPQDQYYAAALPELQAERQAAQAALFQTILGGQGMPIPVPGERQIGY